MRALEDPFLPPYDKGPRPPDDPFLNAPDPGTGEPYLTRKLYGGITLVDPREKKAAIPTIDLVERRILLGQSKAALEAELDDVKKKLAEVDGQIIQEWQESETQNVKRLGYTLSFVRTKYAVGTGDKETLIRTLQGLGAQHCVGVIHQSLTAYVREQEQQGGLPSALVDQVELRDRYSLRMKKG